MGPFRRLAQILARMLRGMARALEGPGSRRVDSLDAATAVLAERFPGAPEHWLRYIASRAPHLVAANTEDARGEGALDNGSSGAPAKVRWWWPRPARHRDARLELQQPLEAVADRPEPGEDPPAHEGDTGPDRPWTMTRAALRPKLRIVGEGPEAPSNRLQNRQPYVAGPASQKARATLATRAPERARRPHLRIAILPEQSRAGLDLDAPPGPASRGASFIDHRQREPAAPAPFSPPRELMEPTLDIQPAPHRAAQAELALWMSSTRPPRPESELSALPGHDLERRTPSFVPWAGQGGGRAAGTQPWSTDTSRNHWPELLPPEPFDVDNVPAQLPNMERLRSEQDFGSWSG
jgi:hypothetical protein